jgi:endogenous inhibitor of DNA gyrase (YacG/DUF329 family)
MSENIKAYWSIRLDAECPHCKEEVDLLDVDDFWDGKTFQCVEHGTAKTRNVRVFCPECGEDFVVDFAH